MFDGAKVMVTGGTGSLGHALVRRLLDLNAKRIVIFSRDEAKQSRMEDEFGDRRLRFFLGDVRDFDRLKRAFGGGIDYVFHLAALKEVHKGEYDVDEFVKTNIMGTDNTVRCAIEMGAKKLVFTSTDKATLSYTSYGRTKSVAESIVTNANFFQRECVCSSVRYGNVFGSRFSVIEIWEDLTRRGRKLPITDPSMTRFNITLEQSVDLVLKAMLLAVGGEIFVPKLKAYSLKDLADAFLELHELNWDDVENIGIRGAERKHEMLISQDEASNAYDVDDLYMILPSKHLRERYDLRYGEEKLKKAQIKKYTSGYVERLSKGELKELIKAYEEGCLLE